MFSLRILSYRVGCSIWSRRAHLSPTLGVVLLLLGSCTNQPVPDARTLPVPGDAGPRRPPTKHVQDNSDDNGDGDAGSSARAAVAEADGGSIERCAQDCDDLDPCTRDVRRTKQGDCPLQCSHTRITAARDGDSCCPRGADSTTDSDCVPACGNGAVDPGEECDGGEGCSKDCKRMLDASLVHRYSFEGTGTTVVDSVGKANGTLMSGELDGGGDLVLRGAAGQYVDLPNGLISALTDVTVEVWVTWSGGSLRQRVFDFGMSTAGEGENPGNGTSFFMLEPSNSNGRLATYLNFTSAVDSAQDRFVEAGAALSTGSMHQVAASFDSTAKTLALYLDGKLQGSRSNVDGSLSQIDDGNVWLGRANYDEPLFRGTIHELRIYDHALSAAALLKSSEAGPDPGRTK